MSYSRRPKGGGHRQRLTNTSIAASGALDVESTEAVSNDSEIDTTVADQRSTEAGMTDSEMSIAGAVDGDCDSHAGAATNPNMQRGSGNSEKGLDDVAPFIKRVPDIMASTLEWRARVLHAQGAPQVTSSQQRHTAEERRTASLEIKIERIRQHYRMQEKILETEIAKHEQRYKCAREQLEKEEKDEEGYFVGGWWDVQSDYQPTECGDDVSG